MTFCLGLYFGFVIGALFGVYVAWRLRVRTADEQRQMLLSQKQRGDYWFNEYREAIRRKAGRTNDA
jgi:hypothetical protein